MRLFLLVMGLVMVLFTAPVICHAQQSPNDTIRLGGILVDGRYYPFVFLPEFERVEHSLNDEDVKRRNLLRARVYAVYAYAITAGTVFKKVEDSLARLDSRGDRRRYLKSVDRKLDVCFKQPLKNLSIEQGHVLIKLINRQTGQNCYQVIKELRGGLTAMMWQGVGVFFNNNLNKDYDPQGEDRELESLVRELEASAAYSYQLFLQDEMMRKIGKK